MNHKLYIARKEARMSQRQLAAELNINSPTVVNIYYQPVDRPSELAVSKRRPCATWLPNGKEISERDWICASLFLHDKCLKYPGEANTHGKLLKSEGGFIMQQFEINLTVQIPDEYVLIDKVHLKELQEEKLSGVYWSMKDVEKRTNKKHEWLKNNILYIPKFKQILDVNNGGFVYYPKVRGENWSFQAEKMATFLDENFHVIFGGD